MRVLALSRTSTIGPSSRYRIEQYAPLLAERDIHVQTRPLFGPTWFRILEIRPGPGRVVAKGLYSLARLLVRVWQVSSARFSSADVILVEQQLYPYLPAWVERLLWPGSRPTILEFDDAIYLTAGHRRKLERLCSWATLVIVGNRFLAEFARPFARHVAVIPTTVDTELYADARKLQRARRAERPVTFRVGWIGLRYNLGFLRELARPLARLAAEGLDVELRVISSGLPEEGDTWGGVRLVHRPWSSATEASELGACDVGVMPLPDDDWARGKCALKLLQCMAAAVPVVCSHVGVNADIVRDGENGLVARDGDGWEQALDRLARDADLRDRLGEAGLVTVRNGYSIRDGADQVAVAYGLARARSGGDG